MRVTAIPVPGLEAVGELDLPAAHHMALDEVLLDAVAAGRRAPVLRFWGWTAPTLVLGSNQSVANEIDLAAVARRGFGLARRLSGALAVQRPRRASNPTRASVRRRLDAKRRHAQRKQRRRRPSAED